MNRGSSRLYLLIVVALTLTLWGDVSAGAGASVKHTPEDLLVWVLSLAIGFVLGIVAFSLRHRFSRAFLVRILTILTCVVGAISFVFGLMVEYTAAQVTGLILVASGAALFAIAGIFATMDAK